MVQVLSILGLSLGLGLTFNAANPTGIRFSPKLTELSSFHLGRSSELAPRPVTNGTRLDDRVASDENTGAPRLARESELPVPIITWIEAKPMLIRTQIVLVDAQSKATFDTNHISEAVSLPASSPDQALDEFARKYSVGSHLVVYSGGPEYSSAVNLSRRLVKRGYHSVRIMTNSLASLVTPTPKLPAQPIGPTQPPTPPAPTPTPISWAEVKSLLPGGNVVLVDSRPKSSYEAGHIPGAISLPLESSDEVVAAFKQKYGTNTVLVVYCSSVSCSRSEALASKLIRVCGYQLVRFMTGGYLEWQQQELNARKPKG